MTNTQLDTPFYCPRKLNVSLPKATFLRGRLPKQSRMMSNLSRVSNYTHTYATPPKQCIVDQVLGLKVTDIKQTF